MTLHACLHRQECHLVIAFSAAMGGAGWLWGRKYRKHNSHVLPSTREIILQGTPGKERRTRINEST